jgi:hypothetical protein
MVVRCVNGGRSNARKPPPSQAGTLAAQKGFSQWIAARTARRARSNACVDSADSAILPLEARYGAGSVE